MIAGYEPRAYWERRLGEHFDLSGAGFAGLPAPLNAALYRLRARALDGLLAQACLAGRQARPPHARGPALDAGCGTGYWVAWWHRRGASPVCGIDLTETSVRELAARFPDDTFVRWDLADGPPPGGPFAAVSCVSVLLHIVDDSAFRRAAGSLAAALAPGGLLLTVDPVRLPAHRAAIDERARHNVVRDAETYRAAFIAAGLEPAGERPVCVLANQPLAGRDRWRLATQRALWRLAAGGCERLPVLARPTAPVLERADRALLAAGALGSGERAFAFRRPRPGKE